MNNKRGQGLSTSTIILLILGIVVLVVLILGFTLGWSKIVPFVSNDNVDSIVQACEISCSTNSVFGFCSKARDLKVEDVELEKVTCNYLAEKETKYGIDKCGSISCSDFVIIEDVPNMDGLMAECDSDYDGKTLQALIDGKLESYPCSAQ